MAAGGARRSARMRWIKIMVGRVAPRAPWGDESNARCPMYAGANLLRERNGCCRFSARAERRALPCPVLRRSVSRKRDTGSLKHQQSRWDGDKVNGEPHKVTGPAKNVAGRAHSAAGTRDCCEISGHSVDGLPHSVPHCAAPTVLARNFSAWPNPERDVVGRVAPRAPPGHRPPRNGAHGVTRPTTPPVLPRSGGLL